jgi:predicted DNA binding protein
LEEHSSVLCYMNRLSDLLFMMARSACFFVNEEEITYQKGKGLEVNDSTKSEVLIQTNDDDDDDDDEDEL